jgi:HD-GYP domain-containing protein (c-di-GMP phosphodiesterase class II)
MIERIHLAAELHDIGKMAIPEAILRKTGPLTDQEWTLMRQHTVAGAGTQFDPEVVAAFLRLRGRPQDDFTSPQSAATPSRLPA